MSTSRHAIAIIIAGISCSAPAHSKDVKPDLQIEIIAPAKFVAPHKKEGITDVLLVFKVTNISNDKVWFFKWPFPELLFKTPAGKTLPITTQREAVRPPCITDYVEIKPKRSIHVLVDAHLNIHNQKTVLGGSDGLGGKWEVALPVNVSAKSSKTYKLSMRYKSEKPDKDTLQYLEENGLSPDYWVGDVKSNVVELELN